MQQDCSVVSTSPANYTPELLNMLQSKKIYCIRGTFGSDGGLAMLTKIVN